MNNDILNSLLDSIIDFVDTAIIDSQYEAVITALMNGGDLTVPAQEATIETLKDDLDWLLDGLLIVAESSTDPDAVKAIPLIVDSYRRLGY